MLSFPGIGNKLEESFNLLTEALDFFYNENPKEKVKIILGILWELWELEKLFFTRIH